MKRRDLLKLAGMAGVLPFVRHDEATPDVEPQETIEDGAGSPDVYAMGSASAFPSLPSGTAMFYRPIPPQFESYADYGMWRLGMDGEA